MEEKRTWKPKKTTKNRNIKKSGADRLKFKELREKNREEPLPYKQAYDSRTYRQFCLKLNMKLESNLLQFLDNSQESPKELFTRLILEDMEKSKNS